MKDSGIPWIGMIPEEWEVKPIGSYFKEINNINSDELETNALQFKMGKIISKKDGDSKYTPETLAAYNIVFPGVIMINGLNLSFDLISQRIAIVRDKGVITSTYLAIALKDKGVPDYFNYLFKAFDNQKVFHSWGKGLRATLSFNILKSENLVFPPLAEQEVIASWLDEKCGEIDELIDVEQKMIDELEAYHLATITETVTRGLNPDVPKSKSTIDQLDEIPSHWKESRLLKIVYLRARLGWRGLKSDEYVEEGYPFLSAFNIINNKLDWSETNYINQFRYDESPEIKLSIGDVLLVKDGAGIGKCARVDDMPKGESTVNSSLGVITVSNELNYKYLYFYFLSHLFQELTERLRNGMGVPHLTQESMKSLVIPLPPINEQIAIADYLDTKCKEIDDLIAVKREKIETLKQYRQSIIFEAVTGKIQIC